MKILFSINYHTRPGQELFISGNYDKLGKWNPQKALKMAYSGGGNWTLNLDLKQNSKKLKYKYFVRDQHGNVLWEWGENRCIKLNKNDAKELYIYDAWLSPSKEEINLYNHSFRKIIFKANKSLKGNFSKAKKTIEFRIISPRISNDFQFCILGDHPNLGAWKKENAVLMQCAEEGQIWSASVRINKDFNSINYKYGLYNVVTQDFHYLEEGFDRSFKLPELESNSVHILKFDTGFRHPQGDWKGAGVSVPVFSLRGKESYGVGDFSDLIDFIDWAKATGMRMVQILPVNETIASHNWLDSYPYKSISVMALHPIYLNPEKMGILKDPQKMTDFRLRRDELNQLKFVDYPEVLKLKSAYYKELFDQEKDNFFDNKSYKEFYKENKDWLRPYAAFVYLRDQFGTADFRKWEKESKFNKNTVNRLCDRDASTWDDISIHFFIQYHLDKQLKEASLHARSNGILLKGDIPIGISPNSVEAWMEPHLFNLSGQAGAPPDDFAIKGQNWGFPTYRWDAMEKEHYGWWRNRLSKMEDYFDAYRIDHILGFFRIWEIPMHAVEGVLGYFNPSLPLSAEEIESYQLFFDYDRFVKPYIRDHIIDQSFGEYAFEVREKFLQKDDKGRYLLQDEFNTQAKVNKFFLNGIEEEELSGKGRKIRDGLFDLIANVIFLELGENSWHPRVLMTHTSSFRELDLNTKEQLLKIYNEFYYRRHNEFWYHKGMEKLPEIMSASNMLVCGEDLGMVPECVPPVMDRLNILSLEIQRMPKDPKKRFAHPADAPYLSVCTSSTHDMSTIRGWWEEDREQTQAFHNQMLGNGGLAPYFAEPWICRQIINQHLYSPAMWVTLPIQDYIAIDGHLRWNETQEEQINHPANVRHKWRYRMFQSIDDLKNADEFNKLLKEMIEKTGRNPAL